MASKFEKNQIFEKLLEFCRGEKSIVALYMFGSAATGRENRNSDLDLAVMVREDINEERRIAWETSLSNLLRSNVDLVIFNRSLPFLQHQILKYGRLIYEGDSSERVRQEVLSRTEYLDGKELFKEIR